MKTIIAAILLCVGSVQSAELLVRTRSNWMKSLDTTGRDSAWMAEYHQVKDKGEVVCIKPDGHKWGNRGDRPVYLIVKLPGVPIDSVRKYMEPDVGEFDEELGIAPVYRHRIWTLGIITDSLLDASDLAGSITNSKDSLASRMQKLKRPKVRAVSP